MGMEMISGNYLDFYQKKDLGYEILITIEESLEMFGIVIMINTLLSYLKQCAIDEVNIKLDFSSKKVLEMRRKDLIV
jgi:hypothetical protein